MEVWKMIFLSKWVIWRFHVNLPGCIFLGHPSSFPWSLHCSKRRPQSAPALLRNDESETHRKEDARGVDPTQGGGWEVKVSGFGGGWKELCFWWFFMFCFWYVWKDDDAGLFFWCFFWRYGFLLQIGQFPCFVGWRKVSNLVKFGSNFVAI